MNRRVRRLLAALAVTAALLAPLAELVDQLVQPQDTTWGAPATGITTTVTLDTGPTGLTADAVIPAGDATVSVQTGLHLDDTTWG